MSLTVLNTEKTDKEKAEEYKQRIIEAHKPLIEILNEATKEGFVIQYQCGPTPTGMQITSLQVLKSF